MNILFGKGIQLLAKPLKNVRKMKGLASWCDSAPSKPFKKQGKIKGFLYMDVFKGGVIVWVGAWKGYMAITSYLIAMHVCNFFSAIRLRFATPPPPSICSRLYLQGAKPPSFILIRAAIELCSHEKSVRAHRLKIGQKFQKKNKRAK